MCNFHIKYFEKIQRHKHDHHYTKEKKIQHERKSQAIKQGIAAHQNKKCENGHSMLNLPIRKPNLLKLSQACIQWATLAIYLIC